MQRGRIILILIEILLFLVFGTFGIMFYNSLTHTIPNYEIIYIEEMPCLIIDTGYGKGVTCDWDKWKGE